MKRKNSRYALLGANSCGVLIPEEGVVETVFLDHVQRWSLQNEALDWEYTVGVPRAVFRRDRALVGFSLSHLEVLARQLWRAGG